MRVSIRGSRMDKPAILRSTVNLDMTAYGVLQTTSATGAMSHPNPEKHKGEKIR